MNLSRVARRAPLFVLLAYLLRGAGPAHAQLPYIRFDRLFPAGGRVGSAVEVTVTGDNFEEVRGLHADYPGIHAEFVSQENNQAKFRLTIDPGTPQGTHDVRAVGRYGISNPELFEVSDGLTEVQEEEPNDTPAQANPVPLNCVVNGRADSSSDDYFRWKATKGQRVILDCWGSRLGSEIDPTLEVLSASGKELAFNRDYNGPDPLIDFTVPEDGEYLVRLYDFNYTGGGAYRLKITTLPYLEAAFPLSVVPGTTAAFTLFGRNLPAASGAKLSASPAAREMDGAALESMPLSLAIPPQPANAAVQEFLFHPASAFYSVDFFQYRLPNGGVLSNPVNIAYARAPLVAERKPDNRPAQAQELTPPCEVNGGLATNGDQDWYSITMKRGQIVSLTIFCERMGLRGDLVILVQNEKGEDLEEYDDSGPDYGGRFKPRNRDPEGRFTAPQDGKYLFLVSDRYQRGGPRFLYRLLVTPPKPDYRAVVVHNTDGNPSALLIRQGGRQYYDMIISRIDDFQGEVHYAVEGLPPGVTCPEGVVGPGVEMLPLVFTAAPDAPVGEAAVRVHTWAMIDGKKLEREARSVVQTMANHSLSRMARDIVLAVRPGAPYVATITAPATVERGGSMELKVKLQRLSPDFQGDVAITTANLPNDFQAEAVTIRSGQTEGTIHLQIGRNARPGDYSVVLKAEGQVSFLRRPKDKNREEARVTDPTNPILLTVTGRQP